MLYVADLYEPQKVEETEEDDPTYPPGIEPPPEYAFILGEAYQYQVSGVSALESLQSTLGKLKIDEILLKDPGGAMTQSLPYPGVQPESMYDKSELVFVGDRDTVEGITGPELHGKPWLSQALTWQWDSSIGAYTLQEDDTIGVVWWKRVYFDADHSRHYYWWKSGIDTWEWAGPYHVDPSYGDYPNDAHPATASEDNELTNAEYAEANGFTALNAEKDGILWPLPVPDTGFIRIARVGILVKSPGELTSLKIQFTSDVTGAGTNKNIVVLSSDGIPDTWADILNQSLFVPMTLEPPPDENSFVKDIVVDTNLLTGSDPLYLWVLLRADHETDFGQEDETGEFHSFKLFADGEEVDITTVSWNDAETKLKVAGSDPVTYRQVKVTKD